MRANRPMFKNRAGLLPNESMLVFGIGCKHCVAYRKFFCDRIQNLYITSYSLLN